MIHRDAIHAGPPTRCDGGRHHGSSGVIRHIQLNRLIKRVTTRLDSAGVERSGRFVPGVITRAMDIVVATNWDVDVDRAPGGGRV